jgi:hypothetical protein
MMSLVQKFNEIDKSKIINKLDFTNFSDNINTDSYKISIPYNYVQIDGIDTETQIVNLVINEINTKIYNDIIKNLFKSDIYDFLDYRGKDLEMEFRDLLPSIINKVGDYKNIICSSLLGSLFSDLGQFINGSIVSNKISTANYLYKVGNISGINLWVDPYMKYNDTRLVAFNEVDFKFEDIKYQEIIDEYSFAPRLISEVEYGHKINDSKVIYLITDQSGPEIYNEYKKIDRDIKINKLLDEY